MKRDDVLRIIAEHKDALCERGAVNIAIFGSVARDEARPDSDVDVMIDLARPMGLFGLVAIKDYLEGILGCEVDLVLRRNLKARIRAQVLSEAIVAA